MPPKRTRQSRPLEEGEEHTPFSPMKGALSIVERDVENLTHKVLKASGAMQQAKLKSDRPDSSGYENWQEANQVLAGIKHAMGNLKRIEYATKCMQYPLQSVLQAKIDAFIASGKEVSGIRNEREEKVTRSFPQYVSYQEVRLKRDDIKENVSDYFAVCQLTIAHPSAAVASSKKKLGVGTTRSTPSKAAQGGGGHVEDSSDDEERNVPAPIVVRFQRAYNDVCNALRQCWIKCSKKPNDFFVEDFDQFDGSCGTLQFANQWGEVTLCEVGWEGGKVQGQSFFSKEHLEWLRADGHGQLSILSDETLTRLILFAASCDALPEAQEERYNPAAQIYSFPHPADGKKSAKPEEQRPPLVAGGVLETVGAAPLVTGSCSQEDNE